MPVNKTANVTCNDGYTLSGVATVKCVMEAGSNTPNWDNVPTCQSECLQALHTCIVHACVNTMCMRVHACIEGVYVHACIIGIVCVYIYTVHCVCACAVNYMLSIVHVCVCMQA